MPMNQCWEYLMPHIYIYLCHGNIEILKTTCNQMWTKYKNWNNTTRSTCVNQCSIQSAFDHNDPQNRKQGVKNDPLPFLWKSQVFGPHKQNNDISHDIDYQELQTFMIQTHLLHSILICIYSVRWSAQHYKQSNTLIFPLHHCIAWLNTTM